MKHLILVFVLNLCEVSFFICPTHTATTSNQRTVSTTTVRSNTDMFRDAQQTEISMNELIKQRWLKILHLSRIPEDIARKVPQYMQALFDTIETNPLASVKLDTSVSGDRAAWAIKAFNASYESENLSISFNILLDFNSSMISKVELVIETSIEPGNTYLNNSYLLNSAIRMCNANYTFCHQSEVLQQRQFDGIRGIYDIYDITSTFVPWWTRMSSCKSCISHVVITSPPFVESSSDISGIDLLLIVYQNLNPDQKLNRRTLRSQPGVTKLKETRHRREVPPGTSTMCQLHEWRLDFVTLGWNWIVAPQGFRADFCDGPCPTAPLELDNINLTNHAFLRTVHRAILGASSSEDGDWVPTPKCVPVRYSPLNILYRASNDTFIVRIVSDMIATSCGCL